MFVYSAFDSEKKDPFFTGEAVVSACSLRRHTNKPIKLVTNQIDFIEYLAAETWFPFTEIVYCNDEVHPKIRKIKSINASETDCVFLDTDTIILADISKVFEIPNFDIAGVCAPLRDFVDTIEKSISFEGTWKYSINSGVLFIRKDTIQTLASTWLHEYEILLERQGPKALDQGALLRALKRLRPNVLSLPNNYNWRSIFGGIVSGACFVVHAHYRGDMASIISSGFEFDAINSLIDHVGRINDETVFRAFPVTRGLDFTEIDFQRNKGHNKAK